MESSQMEPSQMPKFINHGKRWTPEEDANLITCLENGSIETTSAKLDRSPDAVWMRLLHLVSGQNLPELMKKHNIDDNTIAQYKIDLEARRERQKEMAATRTAERQAAKEAKRAAAEAERAATAAERAVKAAAKVVKKVPKRQNPTKEQYINAKITEAHRMLREVNDIVASIDDILAGISMASNAK